MNIMLKLKPQKSSKMLSDGAELPRQVPIDSDSPFSRCFKLKKWTIENPLNYSYHTQVPKTVSLQVFWNNWLRSSPPKVGN